MDNSNNKNNNALEFTWSRVCAYKIKKIGGTKNMANADMIYFLRTVLNLSEEEINKKTEEIGWTPQISKIFNPMEGNNPKLLGLLNPLKKQINAMTINKADVQDSIADLVTEIWQKIFPSSKEKKRGSITLGNLVSIKYWLKLGEEFDFILDNWDRLADSGNEYRLGQIDKLSFLEKMETIISNGLPNLDVKTIRAKY